VRRRKEEWKTKWEVIHTLRLRSAERSLSLFEERRVYLERVTHKGGGCCQKTGRFSDMASETGKARSANHLGAGCLWLHERRCAKQRQGWLCPRGMGHSEPPRHHSTDCPEHDLGSVETRSSRDPQRVAGALAAGLREEDAAGVGENEREHRPAHVMSG